MPRIEPQILQPVAQNLHRLSNNSAHINCKTSLSHLGFPNNVLLQPFLFHLGTQFYSCLCYMCCLRHVCFCHVIISSLFCVTYPYTKDSQCLLRTSCFNMDAKPTLNCPLAFKRRDIWLQHTRRRTALWLPTSGSAVTLQYAMNSHCTLTIISIKMLKTPLRALKFVVCLIWWIHSVTTVAKQTQSTLKM